MQVFHMALPGSCFSIDPYLTQDFNMPLTRFQVFHMTPTWFWFSTWPLPGSGFSYDPYLVLVIHMTPTWFWFFMRSSTDLATFWLGVKRYTVWRYIAVQRPRFGSRYREALKRYENGSDPFFFIWKKYFASIDIATVLFTNQLAQNSCAPLK